MRMTLKYAAALMIASTLSMSPLSAAVSNSTALIKRPHHHNPYAGRDVARYRLEQRRMRAAVTPELAPSAYGANSDAATYGYVNNANCPAHLTNPHQATPDGFWYTPFGKKVNCF